MPPLKLTALKLALRFGAGDYTFSVASVWNWTAMGTNVVLPASTVSATATIAGAGKATIAYTDPTTLTPPTGFTYAGTLVYRSNVGPVGNQEYTLIKHGTGSSVVDIGATKLDTSIQSYASTIYKHTFTLPTTASDLPGFSATFDVDVAQAKRAEGCRMNEFTYAASGVNAISTFEFKFLAIRVAAVANPVASVTVREPIAGTRIKTMINGTAECMMESITINGTNGLEHVFGMCGVAEAQDVQDNDFRRISGSFTRQQVDLVNWLRVLNGTEFSIQINSFGEAIASTDHLINLSNHGIAADGFPFLFIWDLPRNRAGDADAPVSAGRIIESVKFISFKDTATATDHTLTLFNTVANYT